MKKHVPASRLTLAKEIITNLVAVRGGEDVPFSEQASNCTCGQLKPDRVQ